MSTHITPVGYVLSGATSTSLSFQLTRNGEERIRENILLVVRSRKKLMYLIRVDQIRPVSQLYSENSPFVIARREGLSLEFEREIDKFYMIADASVLGELTSSGLSESHTPPLPGDPVYLFDTKKDIEKLYGIKPGDPGFIWIKSVLGYADLPLPLNLEMITMHMGIFGVTGSGKSYSTGVLIEKLSDIPAGKSDDGKDIRVALPTIVVDANADYLDYYEKFAKEHKLGSYVKVIRMVFPHSMKIKRPFTRKITINMAGFNPREIAELIIAYKTGGIGDLPELQVSGLERVLSELRDELFEDLTDLFTASNIRYIYEKLESLSHGKEAIIHPATARAIRTAVDKFYNDIVKKYKLVSKKPSIDEKFIEEIVNNPSLVIIDFSPRGAPGVSQPLKQLVIAYLAKLLYDKFTQYKIRGDEKYLLLLIEEAQNYLPSKNYPVSASVARSYLSLIATQGRKFGIILGLVSQRPSFLDPVVVSMINTFFIFRISPEDVNYVMKLSGGLPESLRKRITRLPRGTAVVTGQMNKLGIPVIIKFEKRTVKHEMGSTNVLGILKKIYMEIEKTRRR